MNERENKPWYDPSVMHNIFQAGVRSDEDIADHFRSIGYDVSRRTISRARASLGFPRVEKYIEGLMDLPSNVPSTTPKAKSAPTGLTPGIKIEGNKQVIVTDVMPPGNVDWDEQISEWGLDPKEWTVEGDTVKFSVWEQKSKESDEKTKLWSWKGELVRKSDHQDIDRPDYDELVEEMRNWDCFSLAPKYKGEYTLIVCLADWQIGSADGRGTSAIVKRVLGMVGDIVDRLHALRAQGYKVNRVHLQGLGDLFEGCVGHYAMQQFSVELDRREQTRVIRRLLITIIKAIAPHVEVLTVGTVPGNHGEHRLDGKAFTTFGDNDDVAVFEQVAEICSESPGLQNVVFSIPDQDMTQTFDFNGTIISFAHAHQATRNKHAGKLPPAQAKVLTWWQEQTFGDVVGLSDSTILVTGHYHHFSIIEHGAKTHIQCPAMDDGSIWFTNQTGQHSRPGTLTFLAGGGTYKAVEILGSDGGED